jgi:hypothetical protein
MKSNKSVDVLQRTRAGTNGPAFLCIFLSAATSNKGKRHHLKTITGRKYLVEE